MQAVLFKTQQKSGHSRADGWSKLNRFPYCRRLPAEIETGIATVSNSVVYFLSG